MCLQVEFNRIRTRTRLRVLQIKRHLTSGQLAKIWLLNLLALAAKVADILPSINSVPGHVQRAQRRRWSLPGCCSSFCQLGLRAAVPGKIRPDETTPPVPLLSRHRCAGKPVSFLPARPAPLPSQSSFDFGVKAPSSPRPSFSSASPRPSGSSSISGAGYGR